MNHHFIIKKIILFKRYLFFLRDKWLPEKRSYSQHSEDRLVAELLKDIPLAMGIYVDVGANQPTQISNTYLFYRNGCSGIAIEPNYELRSLFLAARPRDLLLSVGCGAEFALKTFYKTSTSVKGSFHEVNKSAAGEIVPVVPLDAVWEMTDNEFIFLLSIDTEGYDLEVLNGAEECLNNTLCIIIEKSGDTRSINTKLENLGFALKHDSGLNEIYTNDKLIEKYRS